MLGKDHAAAPVVVQLPAEIDLVNSGEVRAMLVRAATPGVEVVIADLTNTTFCDSAGFRELFAARQTLAAAAVDLRLAAVHQNVTRIMEITGVDQLMTLYPSVRSAAAADAPRPVA
jgi:anti-anti-sigma factor